MPFPVVVDADAAASRMRPINTLHIPARGAQQGAMPGASSPSSMRADVQEALNRAMLQIPVQPARGAVAATDFS